MEAAFVELGNTIGSIEGKIKQGTAKAQQYKSMIMAKLTELMNQIEQLKEKAKNSPVPQLRQQLKDSQDALAEKTSQLAESNSKLEELNSNIKNLTGQLQAKDNDITRLNRDLAELEAKAQEASQENLTNTNEHSKLRDEYEELKKVDAEAAAELSRQLQIARTEQAGLQQQLDSSREQLESFVTRIGAINARLIEEIAKIDFMLNNLDDNTDMDLQIKSIGDTLTSIVNIINNPEQTRGGRRKTKKHKKMRGGYLYSKKSNSNSSSMLRSKSKSRSHSNSNSKSRRKKRLLNF